MTTLTVTDNSIWHTLGTIYHGQTATATWSGIVTPAASDWLGIFAPGAAREAYQWYVFLPGTASGSLTFAVPSIYNGFNYEIRLYGGNGGCTQLASINIQIEELEMP